MSESTVTIELVPAQFIMERGGDLFKEHYQEVALNKSVMHLNPDWDAYRNLEQAGKLFCVAAFLGEELIGYSVNFLGPHLHYSDMCYAQNDLLFVAEEHRKTRVGLDLIRHTEGLAKVKGAKMMLWHAKEETKLAAIMPRLGYRVQDIIYSKVL